MQRKDPLFEIKAILTPCIIMKMYNPVTVTSEIILICTLLCTEKLKNQQRQVEDSINPDNLNCFSFPYRVRVIMVLLHSLFHNNNNNNNNDNNSINKNNNNNVAIFQRATPIHLRLRQCTWVGPKPAWTKNSVIVTSINKQDKTKMKRFSNFYTKIIENQLTFHLSPQTISADFVRNWSYKCLFWMPTSNHNYQWG